MSPGYAFMLKILYHKINSLVVKTIICCAIKKTCTEIIMQRDSVL